MTLPSPSRKIFDSLIPPLVGGNDGGYRRGLHLGAIGCTYSFVSGADRPWGQLLYCNQLSGRSHP
ncbi:MAG: hypothetical protein GDA43_00320 [Hormoscilla sp. SP5CHS1]|nr:hypothetical protein [Hormoscilla sp. SP5CHS1]MBC6475745.1 hypothetical protein [Hormoscilla sp. GM102CHS1]MBO1350401.1 hypothetical protein [Hormoscilla sp. GUM202]